MMKHRCRIYGPQAEAPGRDHVEFWDIDGESFAESVGPRGKYPEGEPRIVLIGEDFQDVRAQADHFKKDTGLVNGVDWAIRGVA